MDSSGGGGHDPTENVGPWTTAELVRTVLRVERETSRRFDLLQEDTTRRFDDLALQLRRLDVPTRSEHADHTRRIEELERAAATQDQIERLSTVVASVQEGNRWALRTAIGAVLGLISAVLALLIGRGWTP